MKIIKIIKNAKPTMSEDAIKDFLYKNFSSEMITGLEYDDPKTIERTLKLIGVESKKSKEVVSDIGSDHGLNKAAC